MTATLSQPPAAKASPAAPIPSPAAPPAAEARLFTLDNISWETYERLVGDLAEQHVRITYDQGRMVLVSPLFIHERVKSLAGRLIQFAAFERDIPIVSGGSTTWKRRDLQKGLEPDECYYITHEPAVRGRTEVDLAADPAPDLAIEVDVTHHPLNRQNIYAALGVQELWRHDGTQFSFLRRNTNGVYEPISASRELPFMTPATVDEFVRQMLASENGGLRAFRDWLQSQA